MSIFQMFRDDRDDEEGAKAEVHFRADQHSQSGVNVLESKTMEGGGRVEGASDGDESESAGQEYRSTVASVNNLAHTWKY